MKKSEICKMRKLSLQEVQKRALNILVAFDNYCNANNIHYMLAYGTCLGAVRHKGFIPWDDDVDVMMPRPDYERLNKLYRERPIAGMELLSLENNKEYSSPIAKLHDTSTLALQHYSHIDRPYFGVYIDIFVIDGQPSNRILQKIFYLISYRIRRFWNFSVDTYNYEKRALVKFSKLFFASFFKLAGYRFWLKLYNWYCGRIDYSKAEYAGVALFSEYYLKEIHKRSLFDITTELNFCGHSFKAPKDYDTYLRQMYGDYMQLPPEEQRRPKHGTDYYDYPVAEYVE